MEPMSGDSSPAQPTAAAATETAPAMAAAMGNWGPGSGYRDGVYHSKRPTEAIPSDAELDFTTYALHLREPQPRRYAERVALVDAPSGQSVTYAELRRRVGAVAAGLAAVGMRRGDVLMIISPNSVAVPVLLLAAASLGAVVTAINPLSSAAEIASQVADSSTTYIAAVPEVAEAAARSALPWILLDGGARPVGQHFRQRPVAYFSGLLEADPREAPKVRMRQTDTALLLYSSGTTGVSKGVVLTHANVIAASCLTHEMSFRDDVQRTYLVSIPMFHIYGMVLAICAQIRWGSKLVILPKFEFGKYLSAIERYRVTHLQLVPPVLISLTKNPLVEKYDLSSLKFIGVGAAPVGKDVLLACTERFKGIFLRQGYALTESCGIGTNTPLDSTGPRYGSVGLLAPNMEAKIVHLKSGKPLPPKHEGEVWLRGPPNMQGYLHNKEATSETLDKEGWLHTGDIGYFADDGYLYIVGRLKELIKYNGYQVAPAELEAILISHHQIGDAAVAGIADERAGQIPVAFVVKHRSSSLTEADVLRFVADQVAPYKRVRKVAFVDVIPRSAAGKILRRLLRLPAPSTSKL